MMRIKIMGEDKRTEVDSKIYSYDEFKNVMKDVKLKYFGRKK